MRGRNNHHRKSQNPLTRVYESNGPDVKIRGTASHIAEKYIQLARDSQSSGDPVAAENYYQHAEHYFRLIAAAQEQFRQQNPYYNQQGQPQQGQPQGASDDGYDDGDDDQPGGGQNEPYNPQQSQPYMPRDAQPFPPRDYQQQQGNRPQQHQQPQPYQNAAPNPQQSAPQNAQQNIQPTGEAPAFGGLPSFITGGAPQPAPQNNGPNGYEQHERNNNQDRFGGRNRRRRHRGPRPDMQGQGQGQGAQNQPQGLPGDGNDPVD
jgi:hypothetical protein